MNEFNKNVLKKTNKQNELKIIINLHPSVIHYLSFTVFDEEFVQNNKVKCKIIINGKEDFELKQLCIQLKDEKFNNFIINNNIEILEIILKETKTITILDNMFYIGIGEIMLIDFENWDTSNVTSMKGMFSYCRLCDNIKGISTLNTSNVNDMSYMFENCYNIPDISNWITSNVKDMSYMFSGCKNIPDISKWNTSNVKSMNHMFEDCRDIHSFSLFWNTSNVEDMSYMFAGCNNIPDISKWNTSNVKNMKGLFYESSSLSSLPDISIWNIENVEDLSNMFDGCKSLKALPNISKWDLSNIKDMSYMFHNCWYLTSFPDISNWKIKDVKNMNHMFHNCFSVLSFPKLNWDISNVQDLSFMFHNFPLYLINFQWNFLQYQNTNHMFTNFDNYTSSNEIINVGFNLTNDRKLNVVVYNDVLVEDLIDKCFWNNKIINYKENKVKFLFNGNELDKKLTVLENGIINRNHVRIQVLDVHNLLGGRFGFRDILY